MSTSHRPGHGDTKLKPVFHEACGDNPFAAKYRSVSVYAGLTEMKSIRTRPGRLSPPAPNKRRSTAGPVPAVLHERAEAKKARAF